MTHSPLRLRLDGEALVANWRLLREMSGGAACGAAVKANGYGLGAVEVATRLKWAGCRDFFVATWAEAALLDLFLLEKAAYEIRYEAANRPGWIGVPLRGLATLADRLAP